jgi:hypothetical protein
MLLMENDQDWLRHYDRENRPPGSQCLSGPPANAKACGVTAS